MRMFLFRLGLVAYLDLYHEVGPGQVVFKEVGGGVVLN